MNYYNIFSNTLIQSQVLVEFDRVAQSFVFCVLFFIDQCLSFRHRFRFDYCINVYQGMLTSD